MQKLMLAAIAAMYLGAFVGCEQESGTKTETTTKSPGGETKTTQETKTEKSGDAKDTATSPAI